jgi:hypothetical protein
MDKLISHFSKEGPMTIREIQIQTTLRFHLTSVKMVIIKKQTTTNAGKDWQGEEPLYNTGGNVKLVQPLWISVWRFLKKTKYRSTI